MKLTRNQRWISTLFLGGVIVTMGGLVYRIVAGGIDPHYERWAKQNETLRASTKLSSVTDKRVVLMKGAQTGGSEAGLNWLGYIIQNAPGIAMLVMPSLDMVRRNTSVTPQPPSGFRRG